MAAVPTIWIFWRGKKKLLPEEEEDCFGFLLFSSMIRLALAFKACRVVPNKSMGNKNTSKGTPTTMAGGIQKGSTTNPMIWRIPLLTNIPVLEYLDKTCVKTDVPSTNCLVCSGSICNRRVNNHHDSNVSLTMGSCFIKSHCNWNSCFQDDDVDNDVEVVVLVVVALPERKLRCRFDLCRCSWYIRSASSSWSILWNRGLVYRGRLRVLLVLSVVLVVFVAVLSVLELDLSSIIVPSEIVSLVRLVRKFVDKGTNYRLSNGLAAANGNNEQKVYAISGWYCIVLVVLWDDWIKIDSLGVTKGHSETQAGTCSGVIYSECWS